MIRIAIPLFTFLLGIATAVWFINHSRKQELRILNPNTRWEKFFFYTIDKRASEAHLEDLRRILLPSGDFEIRAWIMGLNGEEALILRRSANEWSAIHLDRMAKQPPFTQSQESLAAPKSGWDWAWQRLVDAGILTLPDAEALHCNPEVMDGTSYIVEINHDKTYRSVPQACRHCGI